jgi:hypothetical protein
VQQNYKYHLLTVSHAAAPFRWPKLYPDEWLQSVSEKNIICTMEPRHADGLFVAQRHLLPHVYLHPTRDLAVLHFEDEEKTLSMFRNQLKHAFETRLDLVDENIVKGEPGGSVSRRSSALTPPLTLTTRRSTASGTHFPRPQRGGQGYHGR